MHFTSECIPLDLIKADVLWQRRYCFYNDTEIQKCKRAEVLYKLVDVHLTHGTAKYSYQNLQSFGSRDTYYFDKTVGIS